MKSRKVPLKVEAQACDFDDDPDWEADDLKEVFYPDTEEPEGRKFLAQHLLKLEGYQVTSCEMSETHPGLIFRLIRPTSKNFVKNADWTRHFRSILVRAGYQLRRNEITVGVTGKRILVAFQTGPAADVDAILNEPVDGF